MKIYAEPPLTVADLEGTPEDGNRYEVIEGELHVSTSPGYPHQAALGNLYFAFHMYLTTHPIGRAVLGTGVIFDEFNGVIPDLIFVTNDRMSRILANGRFTAAPEIVVEFLSPGAPNEKRDRIVKRQLYSTRGVHEYWIIDPAARTVEIHRKRKTGGLVRAANLQETDDLTSSVLPEFSLPVAQIFE